MRKPADPDHNPDQQNGLPPAAGAHSSAGRPASGRPASGRRDPRRRAILILVNLLIVVLFVTGAYLIAEPYYLHWRQDRKTEELLKSIEQGDGTIVINANELKVPGEEEEFVEVVEDWGNDLTQTGAPAATTSGATSPGTSVTGAVGSQGPTDEPYDPDSTADDPPEPSGTRNPAATPKPTQPQVVIHAIGQMIIDKIDLKMPIADRAEIPQLRVALGLLGGSSMPGKPGNAIVLGHRMYTYGRHFNRLDEVVSGTKVVIVTKAGRRLTYVVDQQKTVLPAEMRRVLSIATKEKQLILVTCTPVRVASHRLLVYCRQVSDEPA